MLGLGGLSEVVGQLRRILLSISSSLYISESGVASSISEDSIEILKEPFNS